VEVLAGFVPNKLPPTLAADAGAMLLAGAVEVAVCAVVAEVVVGV
jgi:hypothetical protein